MKLVEEYDENYGEIPFDINDRIEYIKSKVKTNRSYSDKLDFEIDRIRNIKWKKLDFTFYLVPTATPRPRLGRSGRFYVKGAADNKKFFNEFMRSIEDLEIILTPCKFYCTSYLPTPKSMKVLDQLLAEMGFIRPISKPDFDNLAKTYADMIQGTLLYDDALIVEGVSRKFYSVKPRIEIHMEYMEDFDSLFNRKKILTKIHS